jgi:hypothetical protein
LASRDETTIHNVIVPVGDDLKPKGDYDYVPLDFYYTLRREAREQQDANRTWLVRRATYRAVFNWTQRRTSLDLTSLTAAYQLELFDQLQRIEFPWNGNREEARLLEARLGGQPIELNWNEDRTGFFITVPSAGLTQLEFVIRPMITE